MNFTLILNFLSVHLNSNYFVIDQIIYNSGLSCLLDSLTHFLWELFFSLYSFDREWPLHWGKVHTNTSIMDPYAISKSFFYPQFHCDILQVKILVRGWIEEDHNFSPQFHKLHSSLDLNFSCRQCVWIGSELNSLWFFKLTHNCFCGDSMIHFVLTRIYYHNWIH